MFTTESYWRIPGKFREILRFTVLNRVNFREMAFNEFRLVASTYSPTVVELVGELLNYNSSDFQKVCFN